MGVKYHTLSDEDLVRAITGGDTDLFGIIYDRYADKVFRKCLSFVKDRIIAEDNVQDVFLKVFYQLPKFKYKSKFSTWLYAITYNYCVEFYRKHNRIKEVEIDDRLEVAEDDNAEAELLKVKSQVLKIALEKVSPEDKMILLLKYQDGAPIKEIMDLLHISESAVKMRLARARQRVRAEISKMKVEV